MQSTEIRERFLKFFEKRGHAILPSASLVPENDPSVLFNTAGMQPLVPYLLGQKHPSGDKLVNIQKCVRTGDLDDIGDNRHLSFFEMMGNWSLGAYFKEDAIKWSYEFLTSKEEGLGLDPARLYVTVFEGDENAPKDEESIAIWKSLGVAESRIYPLGIDDNWWSPGDNGPCGPDTEMFYDLTDTGMGELSKEAFLEAVKREDLVEIWNDVFMEYEKKDGKVIGKLAQKNVDTGAGLERMTAVMQGKKTAYDTDLFSEIMGMIDQFSSVDDIKARRIVADHVRTSVFMIADGVLPSNTDRGYVLRRLIRRAVRFADVLQMKHGSLSIIATEVIQKYKENHSNILSNVGMILEEIGKEEIKFRQTLEKGLKELNLILSVKANPVVALDSKNEYPSALNGKNLFDLFTTHGLPPELAVEIAREKSIPIRGDALEICRILFERHQKLSQTASAGMFKGGLANHNEKTIKLHTAHHLLLAALQEKFGKQVKQRGSNITEERLRMDFVFDRKLTDEEKKEVEDKVNEWIDAGYPVVRKEMSLAEAEKLGAEMEFGAKYPEMVSVYVIESGDGAISKEFCGGPHVTNTKEIGHFKIQKEEASSQGVRRIKAVIA
jgi:alanyl-tRNA synthetase